VTAVSIFRRLERAGLLLLWSGTLLFVFSLWLFQEGAFNSHAGTGMDRLVEGGAQRPYSARLLVPWMARAAVAPWSPESRSEAIDGFLSTRPGIAAWLETRDIPRRHGPETFAMLCIDFLVLVGFAICIHGLAGGLFVASKRIVSTAPALALLFLPLFYGVGTHQVWDFPALFFSAAALLAIDRRAPIALAAILAFGTLNKETMALALLVYLIPSYRRALGGRWYRFLALHAGTVVAARAVALAYSSPAAGISSSNNYLRSYLADNLFEIARAPFLLEAERTATVLFFALLVFAGLRRKPALLLEVAPVALPFLALYLWGGLWGEIRAVYELYPILFLMGFQSCVEWIGLPLRARNGETAPQEEADAEEPSLVYAGSCTLAGAVLGGSGVLMVVQALSA